MTNVRVIHNGDHMEAEIALAGVPPEERPDWPLPSFDAQDWARSFCKIAKGKGLDIDEGWMISWFACALMRGFDEHAARAVSEPQTATDYQHLYQCELAAKAVMQCDIDSLRADIHAVTNSAETLEALKTAHQALLEVRHAQQVGPEWYTRGAGGLFQQVRMWVDRGLDAINKARPTSSTEVTK